MVHGEIRRVASTAVTYAGWLGVGISCTVSKRTRSGRSDTDSSGVGNLSLGERDTGLQKRLKQGHVPVSFSVRQRRCISKPRVVSVSERTLGQTPRRVFYTKGVTSLFFRFVNLSPMPLRMTHTQIRLDRGMM